MGETPKSRKVHVFSDLTAIERACNNAAKKWDGLTFNWVPVRPSYALHESIKVPPEGMTLDIDLDVEGYSGDYLAYLTGQDYKHPDGHKSYVMRIYTLERNSNSEYSEPDGELNIHEQEMLQKQKTLLGLI